MYKINEDWGVQFDARTGKPLLRAQGVSTPCRLKPDGCPKGTPDKKRSLTPQNRKAYEFHKQCEAVNRFPDDAIVTQNAGIIRRAEEYARRMENKEVISWLKLIAERSLL